MSPRISSLLLLLFTTLVFAQSDSTPFSHSITLSYQSLSSPSVKPLATIFYNTVTFKSSLSSWTPPPLDSLLSNSPPGPTSPDLIRVLLPSGTSTLTSLATFNTSLSPSITLQISPFDNESILSASITAHKPSSAVSAQRKASKQVSDGAEVQIHLQPAREGPYPKLNSRKPVVVGSDGKEQAAEEAEERSFFQKYWWVFLLVAVFAMSGGGGG